MIQSKLQAKKAFCFDSMTSISVKTPFLITQDTGKFRVLLLALRTDSWQYTLLRSNCFLYEHKLSCCARKLGCWKRLLDVLQILPWTQMQNKIANAVVWPLIVLKDLWCRKAEGPLQWIPAVLSSAHPTAVLGESLAAPGYSTTEQAGFGHREISQLGGKALWSIPCAHREVSGSTALLRGQLSKGGRWRRVAGQCQLVPIIASMSWLLHFKAGSSLSPILPHRSICRWKILSKFWPHPLSVFLHRTEM